MDENKSNWTCPQGLIEFAKVYISQSIHIEPWHFDVTKDDFVTNFVESMLTHGRNVSGSEKDYRKWMSENAKTISITFQYNEGLAEKAIRDECTVQDVLKQNESYKQQNKRVFDDITSHHMNLKTVGWSEITEKATDLEQYAQAANVMGEKLWVTEANRWMESFILDYFRHSGKIYVCMIHSSYQAVSDILCSLGAKKVLIKSHKRRRVDEYRMTSEALGDTDQSGANLPPSILTSLEQMKNYYESTLPDDICTHRQIRLLDVGSCYNPFVKSPNAESFQVTALDLQPVNSSVYQCDFLELEVGTTVRCHSIGERSNSIAAADGVDSAFHSSYVPAQSQTYSRLLELPASSYDAITMSLVLSYLPTPEHRRQMITKARALLVLSHRDRGALEEGTAACGDGNGDGGVSNCYPGVLVIAEKASIFGVNSGRKQTAEGGDSMHMTLRRGWVDAICNEGFELLQYKDVVLTRHHVHLFAFKAVGVNEGVVEEGRKKFTMWIKSEVKGNGASQHKTISSGSDKRW
jgi:hypothetical protein